jgi:hypothetical protein
VPVVERVPLTVIEGTPPAKVLKLTVVVPAVEDAAIDRLLNVILPSKDREPPPVLVKLTL